MNRGRPASRVWVLPNRNTIGLVAVLIGMWWAGVSQSNGAAYLLCFVLAAVAVVSVVHCWANLRGLVFEADPVRPVFAGEELSLRLRTATTRRREHYGIRFAASAGGRPGLISEVPRNGDADAEVRVVATTRGFFPELKVKVESRYPLGFFTARCVVRLPAPHWIYPRPLGSRPLPVAPLAERSTRDGTRIEGDDFGGVRAWRAGESQRHIDWKAAARGQPLLIKQWTGEADTLTSIDWEALPDSSTEARLSQLAQWVVQAERDGGRYGFRIPGTTLPADRGEAHFHRCLRALASFEREAAP